MKSGKSMKPAEFRQFVVDRWVEFGARIDTWDRLMTDVAAATGRVIELAADIEVKLRSVAKAGEYNKGLNGEFYRDLRGVLDETQALLRRIKGEAASMATAPVSDDTTKGES